MPKHARKAQNPVIKRDVATCHKKDKIILSSKTKDRYSGMKGNWIKKELHTISQPHTTHKRAFMNRNSLLQIILDYNYVSYFVIK
jgi:hypothetical protein